jgi:hypothetical protein
MLLGNADAFDAKPVLQNEEGLGGPAVLALLLDDPLNFQEADAEAAFQGGGGRCRYARLPRLKKPLGEDAAIEGA